MNIHTAKYVNMSDIAEVLGIDVDDLAEQFDEYTWGDTEMAFITLPVFLRNLDINDEETVMESLWDIIGTEPAAAAEYYVNLAA
jgi:hypothetical protein